MYLGTDPALPSVYDTALLGLLWSALTGWLQGVALVGVDGPGGGVPRRCTPRWPGGGWTLSAAS
ncbi:hypothetical protein ACH4U6_22155 [Streptomyces netropsis]|uniref:imine reductase family protein n=1 Tax=Streptomyces netropsis TaxID=55404 RepID=UPI00378B5B8B